MDTKGRIILLLVVGVLLAALLGGCAIGPPQPTSPPTASADSAVLNHTLPGPTTPIYLVVDGDHSATLATVRQAAFQAVVAAAYRHKAAVILATAGAGPGNMRIVFSALAVAEGANGHVRRLNQAAASALMGRLFAITDQAQATGSVDVLGSLSALAADLHGVGGHVDVLVMASGLQRGAPLDLVGDPRLLDDPAGTAAALAKAHILPTLANWDLAFLSQDAGSSRQLQQLTALWYHIATAAGAQMDGYQQSLVSFPLARMAEPSAAGVVLIPTAGRLTVRVPDRVLFGSDQATLRASAAPVIAQMRSLLAERYPNARAKVLGFCDSTGTASWNQRLSARRAAAVATALEAAGIASGRLTTEGLGASHYVASNATDQGRARNRRVELVIETGS